MYINRFNEYCAGHIKYKSNNACLFICLKNHKGQARFDIDINVLWLH